MGFFAKWRFSSFRLYVIWSTDMTIHELTLVCVASIPKMKISWATAIDITKFSLICVSPALRFLKTCKKRERNDQVIPYSDFLLLPFWWAWERSKLPPTPLPILPHRYLSFLTKQSDLLTEKLRMPQLWWILPRKRRHSRYSWSVLAPYDV